MLSPVTEKLFDDFGATAYGDDALDPKTAHLIKMAAAMSIGCYP
jgi:alkylhydroperoxidase/carboxymuconolactone decarboxylase family protein YurZ